MHRFPLNVELLKQPQIWQAMLSLGLLLAVFSWKAVDLIYVLSTILIIILKNPLKIFSGFSKTFKLFNWFVLIWILANLSGSFTTNNITQSQWNNFLDLRWIWSFYVCLYIGSMIATSEKKFPSYVKPFLFIFAICLAITCLFGKFTPPPDSRFKGFYEHPNSYAFTFILAWAFLFGWSAKKLQSNQPQLKISLLLILLLSGLLYATSTRGAWIAAFACLLVSIILFYNKTLLYGSLLTLLAVAFAYVKNLLGFKDRLLYSLNFSADNSQGQRLSAWKASWNIFLDHPFFGTGFTENRNFFPQYYHRLNLGLENVLLHSHNQYLQILNDSGIIGFIGFYGALSMGMIFFFKHSFNKDLEISSVAFGAFSTLLAFSIISLFDCPILSPESRNYLFLIVGSSYGFLATKEIIITASYTCSTKENR